MKKRKLVKPVIYDRINDQWFTADQYFVPNEASKVTQSLEDLDFVASAFFGFAAEPEPSRAAIRDQLRLDPAMLAPNKPKPKLVTYAQRLRRALRVVR